MSNRSGQPNDVSVNFDLLSEYFAIWQSPLQPIMLDNSISQSKSFKILMHNVLGHEHE